MNGESDYTAAWFLLVMPIAIMLLMKCQGG